jgi:hypothetical protein
MMPHHPEKLWGNQIGVLTRLILGSGCEINKYGCLGGQPKETKALTVAIIYLTNDDGTCQTKLAVTGQVEDFAVVPRVPTKAMLEEGWYEAHEENAAGVWEDMIKAWETERLDREQGG